MKQVLVTAGALACCAGLAHAGGVERSTQSVGILFENGPNYLELSYGRVRPSVSGHGVVTGADTGGVAHNHYLPGVSYKRDLTDQWSLALIYDQFYGADTRYPTWGAAELAGTTANVQSEGYTALLRYKFNENWSAHGGVRVSSASASVGLRGLAYGPLSGYRADFDNDWAAGYVIGGAYERPDIAMRVALTYQSKVTHTFDTIETGPVISALFGGPVSSKTEVDTPEAITLDFQSGIAPDWLVYGSVRWVHWSQFRIDPKVLHGTFNRTLVTIDNTTTWTVGLGHKFNDTWSGSVFATWENSAGDDLISPLGPTRGYKGVGIAAIYTRENMKITAGVRYLWLGDARAQTSEVARANFTDNHAVAAGVRVGFTF